MPRFFICYRRQDCVYAAQSLCLFLQSRFGKESVFIDVDSMPVGVDFRQHIRDTVTRCDAVLAIIGDKWLASSSIVDGTEVRRLDDPLDFVRLEIAMALTAKVPVVPILVDGAPMPKESELPEDLRDLAYRNAAELRPGRDYAVHLERLVSDLDRLVSGMSATGTTAIPSITPIAALSIDLQLAPIPAGEFLMGSADDDATGYLEERPRHRVVISKAFYFGLTPVTYDQFVAVTGTKPSHYTDGRRPVASVTWLEAIEFCNHLSQRDGLPPYYRITDGAEVFRKGGAGYRLPSEADWEYACRAGSTGIRWFPEHELDRCAWHHGNAEGRTHRVGRKDANPWGVHDILGNVWEWCWDRYLENYYQQSPLVDPAGPNVGRERVLRGGSFGDRATVLRSANRFQLAESSRLDNVGFRVAKDATR